jgi:hypothetical protein
LPFEDLDVSSFCNLGCHASLEGKQIKYTVCYSWPIKWATMHVWTSDQ